mmetsp:Transcript_20426/g.65741  ORF Transcript_20426/g.65741 Transcript_20426/m.65741 type:complete len:359 (-) Transcript_20426:259-1335(-)
MRIAPRGDACWAPRVRSRRPAGAAAAARATTCRKPASSAAKLSTCSIPPALNWPSRRAAPPTGGGDAAAAASRVAGRTASSAALGWPGEGPRLSRRHAVWYRCPCASPAPAPSTSCRLRSPTSRARQPPARPPPALSAPSLAPPRWQSHTAAVSGPEADATARSKLAAWPPRPASSTANGKAVPPRAGCAVRRAESCSAPSRSAGCTSVPSPYRRRWSRADAAAAPAHAASSTRKERPYSSPEERSDAYAAAGHNAAARRVRRRAAAGERCRPAAPTSALMCRAVSCGAPACSRWSASRQLRVSTRAIAPPATAQPTHSPSGSSSGKGCTKTPCRSVARVDEAPPAASPQHTARAISR